MIQILIILGLIIIPLSIHSGIDPKDIKECLSIIFALAIGFMGFRQYRVAKIPNAWFFIIPLFMFICTFFVPQTGFILGSVQGNNLVVSQTSNYDNLWNYKPIFYALVYLLMFCAVAKAYINYEWTFTVISWVGFIVSGYAILQVFHLDQFFKVLPPSIIGNPNLPQVVSTIGQHTLVASFIVLCIPIMVYEKRWLFSVVSIIAVILCESKFALLAIIPNVLLLNGADFVLSILVLYFGGAIVYGAVATGKIHPTFEDHGRFEVWRNIIQDVLGTAQNGARYTLMGYGPGAFRYIYPFMHNTPWFAAHNEYLEFLYNCGVFGLTLFLTAIGSVYNYARIKWASRKIRTLTVSLIASSICAFGTFQWQLGAHMFYTVLFVGLIYNLGERNESSLS